MRCLLDTNIILFLTSGDNISNDVMNIIEDYTNKLYVSSLSILEISHLFKSQKIKSSFKNVDELVIFIQNRYYIDILHTKDQHLQTLYELEPIAKHSDPIDHFIISQAITERMVLVSSDTKFNDYKTQNLQFVFNKR